MTQGHDMNNMRTVLVFASVCVLDMYVREMKYVHEALKTHALHISQKNTHKALHCSHIRSHTKLSFAQLHS